MTDQKDEEKYVVTYKLVGVKGNMFYRVDKTVNTITLTEMHQDFIELKVKEEIEKFIKDSTGVDQTIIDNPLSSIMFITERESVNEKDKKYNIKNDNNEKKRTIHVFSKNSNIREILQLCFSKLEYNKNQVVSIASAPSVPISQELHQEVIEEEPDIQTEVTINSNNELFELLQDPDFLKLIEIYKIKSHYFSTLLNFISIGDIIETVNFEEITIDDFSNYEEAFSKLHHILQNYKSNMEEENLKKLLYSFKGNYNLVFRYLLVKNNLQMSDS